MRRALLVLALTLLAACSEDLAPPGGDSPASAPVVSEESALGGPHVQLTGADAWGPLQVAAGAGEHLVVWSDPLAGPTSTVTAARVGFDGALLDPAGKAIAPGFLQAAAAGDEGYLVVTLDESLKVRGVRVGRDGAPLDPAGFPISEGPASVASVAFDGTSYLVAWSEFPDIRYTRVSPGGEVLDPIRAIPGATVSFFAEWRGLACAAGICLVGWIADAPPAIRVARIDGDGDLLDPVGLEIGAGNSFPFATPSISSDGSGFVAAWFAPGGVFAARVTAGGDVLDPDGIHVGDETLPIYVTAAFDGASTVVAWGHGLDNPSLRVARLSPAGEVLDAPPVTLSGDIDGVAIGGQGDGSFVSWLSRDADASGPRLVGTRLTQASEALDAPGIPLHTVANTQRLPAVAGLGDGFLAAWADSTARRTKPAEPWDLYATRVTRAGAALDPEGLLLARGITGASAPRAVSHKSGALVLFWQPPDECDGLCAFPLRGVRVSPAGDVLDPIPIELPVQTLSFLPFQGAPLAVASNGASSLIVQVSDGVAIGTWLDPDGEVGSVRTLGTADGEVAVASDGEGYLAVWSVGSWPTSTLFGVRVGADGRVLDAGGITIAAPGGFQQRPAVAFDGERYVVAWERTEVVDEAPRGSVVAARVTPAGEVLDPGGVLIGETGATPLSSAGPGEVAVGSDGRRAIIAWRGPAEPGDPASAMSRLGATLGADGVPSPAFVISAAADEEGAFELGASCGGALAVYERFLPDPPFGSRRMMARSVGLGAEDGVCEASGGALVAGGGCRAAGAPPGSAGWLAAAVAGALAAAGRRAAGAACRGGRRSAKIAG